MEMYAKNVDAQEREYFTFIADTIRPAIEMEIDEWAEGNLELSPRVTRFPGRVRFDMTPYLREPLKAAKHCRRVVGIFGAQTGKTLMIQCFIGYIIDQNPLPMMITYPNQQSCKRRSRKHIQPFIKDSPCLAQHLTGVLDDLQLFEYHLDRLDIVLSWAGSETMIASEPIAVLVRDEIAKFDPGALGNSEARTTSYDWMARIFDVTTPKGVGDPGYDDLFNGTNERYSLPCPHCGFMQVLIFKQMIFPSRNQDENFAAYLARVERETFYKCENCEKEIYDRDKPKMLAGGVWKPLNPEAQYRSFQLAQWYAPWVRFGRAASMFLQTKDDREEFINWVNNFAAEFWEDKGEQADKNKILAHRSGYAAGEIPTGEPCILFLTCDIQASSIWYVVRAHTYFSSWLVEFGNVAVYEDVLDIRRKKYQDLNLKEHSPILTFMDSGYRTKEVYDVALANNYVFALKGQDGNQTTPIRWQNINKYPGTEKDMPGVVKLMHIDTVFFKEELLTMINRPFSADGKYDVNLDSWFLHSRTSDGYAHHLMSEGPIDEKDKKGHTKRVWHQFHKTNHLLDCEVYQLAARYLYREELKKLNCPDAPASRKRETYTQKPPENWG